MSSSPIGALRKTEAIHEKIVLPSNAPPAIAPNFWQEFLRVQCDKIILLGLIIFLWKVGLHEDMKYVIGGLIVAINHNRFKWT